jgi:hypothetical protein
MHTRFRSSSRFPAVLCAVLFVAATVLVLLLFSARQTLLNAETYKRGLMENNGYDRLPARLAEQAALYVALEAEPVDGAPDDNPLSSAPADVQACARQALGDEAYQALYDGQRPATRRETRRINACIRQARREARLNNPGIGSELMPILEDLSTAQWEALVRFLLPPEELRHLTESALDEVFAYLNGESDTASLSLVDLKSHLTGQAGQELILLLLSTQPPCTQEQEAQINAGNFENGGATAIYCAASGETLAMVMPHMQNRLSRVAGQIPEEAVLINPDTASGGNGSRRDPLTSIRTIRTWIGLSPLLPSSLLLLMTLFGVRSARDLLRWWGIPLFGAGVLVLGIGLAAQPLLDWPWVNYAVPQFPPILSSGLAELGHDVFRSVVHELRKWIMLEAGLIALPGLGAILASSYVDPLPASRRSDTKI